MPVVFHTLTDLLDLASSAFKLVDASGEDEEGQWEEAPSGDGTFEQEDIRQTNSPIMHKYTVLLAASVAMDSADRPRVGKHTGLSSVVYGIDSVKINDKTKHWTMTVMFHRKYDVASSVYTIEDSDFGI